MDKQLSLMEISNSYLLAELEAVLSEQKSMYALLDKEVQYYFALFSALVAAGGLIAQATKDIIVVILTVNLFSMIATIAGYRLLRRVTAISGMLALYGAQSALIRRRFLDIDESLRNYIILPVASTDGPAHSFIPTSKHVSMRLIPVVNSVSLFVSILMPCLGIYEYVGQGQSNDKLIIFIVIGVLGSSVASIAFYLHQRQVIYKLGDDFLTHVTSVTHKVLSDIK